MVPAVTDGSAVQGVPTWFGPERARLFGVVHVPGGGAARAGVVICPTLGREYQDSYRGLKLLAQQLCATGFAVLRFDYLGTGDSTGDQYCDDAVDGYLDSIRAAVEYLRDSGMRSVSLVGLRAGALLAATAAASIPDIDSLILWDPITDGRRYVREQQSLYQLTVGGGESDGLPPEPGVVPLLSITLSSAAAAALGALKLPPVDGATSVLVLSRSERVGDRKLAELLAADNCELREIAGQPAFIEPPGIVVKIPMDTLATIAKWLDANLTSETVAFDPVFADDAVVVELPDGRKVVESLTTLGPNRLFAIRSGMAGAAAGGPTVLIHNTASDHRVGPGRLWTETARELASHGAGVVRFDRRKVGDTGVAADEYSWITSAEALADVTDVVEALAVPADRLIMAGICSGAWNAAYGAMRHGAKFLVLLNLPIFAWRRIDGVNERLWRVTDFAAGDSDQRTEEVPAWVAVKQWLKGWLPYQGWLLLGRLGYTQVPEVLFASLGKRGLPTELVLSPWDYEWFVNHQGLNGIKRLTRNGWAPKMILPPGGDHSVLHRGLQNFAREHLLNTVRREFGGLL